MPARQSASGEPTEAPATLRILGRANSMNVRKVLWTRGEIGIPFEREDWGRGFRNTDDPEFRRLNPTGHRPPRLQGARPEWIAVTG